MGNVIPDRVVLDDGGNDGKKWRRLTPGDKGGHEEMLDILRMAHGESFQARRENRELSDSRIGEGEMYNINRTRNAKSLADVLEEAEVFIDTHFFNGFTETVLFASEECPGKSEHD